MICGQQVNEHVHLRRKRLNTLLSRDHHIHTTASQNSVNDGSPLTPPLMASAVVLDRLGGGNKEHLSDVAQLASFARRSGRSCTAWFY